MKKFFIALGTSALILSAVDFQEAKDKFESKDYKNSYRAFKELFQKDMQKDMSNPEVNFYLGLSSFELGNYEEALSSFERVLIFDENHLRSRLELGRVYLALDMKSEARVEFEKVLSSNPPKEVRENIKKLLKKIEISEKRNFLRGYLSVGFGYDSNVNSSPVEESLSQYMVGEYNLDEDSIEQDGELDDSYHKEMLNLTHIYDFKDRGGYFLDSSLLVYNQGFFSEDDYNILYLNAKSGVGFSKDRYRASIPIEFGKLIYGGDELLYTIGVAPKFSTQINSTLSMQGRLKYQKKKHDSKADSGRDSEVKEMGFGFSKIVFKDRVSANYTFSNESKDSNSDDKFVDRDSHNINISYLKKLYSIDMLLSYIYRKYLYDDLATKKGYNREDNQQNFYISLSKEIYDLGSVSLGYSYTNSSSNYTPSDYDKSIYSINYNINF